MDLEEEEDAGDGIITDDSKYEVDSLTSNLTSTTTTTAIKEEPTSPLKTQSRTSSTPEIDEEKELKNIQLIIRMQAMIRKFRARIRLPVLLEAKYEKIYDPKQKKYFYYNKETDTSSWKKPKILRNNDMKKISSLYNEEQAVVILQCWYRTYVAKKRVRKLYKQVVKVVKDAVGTGMYQNPRSKQNMWELPYFMGGEMDHDYSDDESDNEMETKRQKKARKRRERKLRRTQGKGGEKEEKETPSEDDRSTTSGNKSNGSENDESDASSSDYDSDDSSLDSATARDRRRMKRKYPRSRAQQLVDVCEDREDKLATLTLNLSRIGAKRFTTRIYDLTHLKQLILSHNQLTRINPDIKFLDNLELLDLRSNLLTKLPIELEELPELKTLLVGHNRISTYPGNLYKLTKMQSFDMSFNKFQRVVVEVGNMSLLKDTHEWEVGIGLWKFLQELNASNNSIDIWPQQIEKIPTLKMLNLSHNKLAEIPSIIALNETILYLDLSFNSIELIPPEIYKLRFLETLKLSHNNISKFPPIPPPQIFEDDSGLGQRDARIPVEIRFHSLVTLDFSYNKFQVIDDAIAAFPKVITLDLSHNEIHTIDACIGKLTKMKDLNLEHNKLSKMPKAFATCMSLTTLRMNNNLLVEIPESIQNLIQLRFLDLSHNTIVSQSMKPTFFSTLSKMVEIYLQHNRIVNMPFSFFTLNKLTMRLVTQ